MRSGWVVFGYAASYAAIVAYATWVVLRVRALRRNFTPRR